MIYNKNKLNRMVFGIKFVKKVNKWLEVIYF